MMKRNFFFVLAKGNKHDVNLKEKKEKKKKTYPKGTASTPLVQQAYFMFEYLFPWPNMAICKERKKNMFGDPNTISRQ